MGLLDRFKSKDLKFDKLRNFIGFILIAGISYLFFGGFFMR